MARHVAFLRAIDVGGDNVKVEAFRALFEALGYEGVETFIASGNVIDRIRVRERGYAGPDLPSIPRDAVGGRI
jgi:uncharacterized protein (DUF1697 family)